MIRYLHRGATLLVLATLALIPGACSRDTNIAVSSSHPNVVLIVTDTLRADRVDATRNGLPVMPFLARMAREGTRYTNAISPCSWTKPAMASIFTGVYPGRHGVTYSARNEDPEQPTSDRLSEDWETMAEWLASHGYTPWGFQTNANLTRALGFAQGFAENHYTFSNGAPAGMVTHAARGALANLPEPFFLYAHYMDPHAPYRPDPALHDALGPQPELPEYDQALLDDDAKFMAYYLDQVRTAIGLQPAHIIPQLSEAGLEAVRHRYDLECLAMDQAIEVLVTDIRTRHPDTVFLFLSDHGEEFWERGGMGHGTTLHPEQARVPFILFDPARPGRTESAFFSTLNLMPLLAMRLGLQPSPAWQEADTPTLAYTRGPWPALGVNQAALFEGSHALLHDRAGEHVGLYDWAVDPEGHHDIAAEAPHLARDLHQRLDALDANAMSGAPAPSTAIDEAALEALEAIGYIDDARSEVP